MYDELMNDRANTTIITRAAYVENPHLYSPQPQSITTASFRQL